MATRDAEPAYGATGPERLSLINADAYDAEQRRESVNYLRGILLTVWSAALDAMAMQDEPTFADLGAEEREQAYLKKQDHHVGKAIEAIREWCDGETECR